MKAQWYKNGSEILTLYEGGDGYTDYVDLDEPTVRELYEFIKANYDTKWWDSFNETVEDFS